MICVVDTSVAVKWFVAGDWALQIDHVDNALALLQATAQGRIQLLQPPQSPGCLICSWGDTSRSVQGEFLADGRAIRSAELAATDGWP